MHARLKTSGYLICQLFVFVLFYFIFLPHLTSGYYFRMKMKILLTRWKFPTLKFIMKKSGTCSVQEGMYMLLVEMNLGADFFKHENLNSLSL